MILQGILSGLLSVTCFCTCYVLSRRFLTKPGNRPLVLFGLSHVWIGGMALLLLPIVWSSRVLDVASYAFPLVTVAGVHLLGQACLFQAVRWIDASRVAPLIPLKIIFVTMIATALGREQITLLQWVGVFICVVGALGISYSGERMPLKALLIILMMCFFYALSDLQTVALMDAIAPERSTKGMLLACSLAYILMGIVAMAVLLVGRAPRQSTQRWADAFPVGLTWFLGAMFFFITFGLIGVVFGNVVQSTRGIIAILIGAIVAAWGHVHLEKRVGRWVLARRIVAAVLICSAVSIFAWERGRVPASEPAHPVRPPNGPSGVAPRPMSSSNLLSVIPK